MQTTGAETAGSNMGQDYGASWGQDFGGHEQSPSEAAVDFIRDYSRERPEVVALWAFGLGFVLGWKLKPW
jgi:hypothetical protein